jgi:putative endopeptidase
MRWTRSALAGILLAGFLGTPVAAQQLPLNFAAAQDPEGPKTIHGFDRTAMDTSVSACQNFFQYACGSWLKANPIPADQSAWGRFNELFENNRLILRGILEKAREASPGAPEEYRKVGDYYAACMDEDGANAAGLKPINGMLSRVSSLSNKSDLAKLVADLHLNGVNVLFGFGSGQDFQNAADVIAVADQGGLGLPDRDFYLEDNARFQRIREAYREHVVKMFTLAGDSEADAARNADVVIALEKSLAEASLDRVSRRDTRNLDHRMPIAEAAKLMPHFDFPTYLREVKTPKVDDINVFVPKFFESLSKEIETRDLTEWKTYFRWHILRATAPMLTDALAQENFAFYGKVLQGRKEMPARWKRCVQATDAALGEALGKAYVEQTYGKDGAARMAEMVRNLTEALREDIEQLDWMTPATRQQALKKLSTIANKVGHPTKWRDYSSVTISRKDPVANFTAVSKFDFARDLAKIGKPVDKEEWFMTPPTVNAYYDPQNNNINFPAGILQPPFFDKTVDDAVNYGAIGAVIGHELTHGFDDQGRRFDADGNLKDWWTEEDAKAFEARAECIVQQYGNYKAIDDVGLNGLLTLGENVADNGGLRIAYLALLRSLSPDEKTRVIDGFSPAQRFFLGWGQVWCNAYTPETARLRAQTDPHSPGNYRVNGVVSNMPEFAEAFGCKPGDPMVRENACRVW